jgi:hypothetical protein
MASLPTADAGDGLESQTWEHTMTESPDRAHARDTTTTKKSLIDLIDDAARLRDARFAVFKAVCDDDSVGRTRSLRCGV